MSRRIMSLSAGTVGAALLFLTSGCAVEGVGYGGDVGYVGGVYEPYGYDYGGWGGGYRVGPPRGGYGPGGGGWRGNGHPGGPGGHGGPPGIPGGPHGGGGGPHGGGGHH